MPEQGSSFIPKSGIKTVQRTRGTRRIYLLAYISYIIFFTTLFAVIGVYVYGYTVTRNLNSTKEQLVVEEQRFDVADIDNIKQLDKRIQTASRLLDEATAPSRLFADIESIVASNIYFTGMVYEQLPNRQFQIDLTGRAANFNQIIGQQNLLSNSSLLNDARVENYDFNVTEGEEGEVFGDATLSFTFSDTRDLSAISYIPESTVLNDNTPATEVVSVSAATSSSSAVGTTTVETVETEDQVTTEQTQ